ncbi:PRC-barrel domain-containing protein [Cutibacterium sp.]|uniref:PRC-barrel domain-containing protein n=1 Tax=Cutibacterium sp. TaxID=1912221 RepID=UPI0026DC8C4B|nr:PRC-barrel domain-containing protein [Cutibacterium sp.]MDO4412419.1 photosystem reaction center subunit H [Cutibacterium sp.]
MDISAMDPKDIPGLFDAEVIGPDGEKVGTIQQIFADEVTGAVTFVTVLSEGHEYFIPVRGADYSSSHVNVPFSRDIIETAPEASEEDDLSRDREAEVYGHYGLEPARRSGLSIADDDDSVIAQPGRGAVSESDIVGAQEGDADSETETEPGDDQPSQDAAETPVIVPAASRDNEDSPAGQDGEENAEEDTEVRSAEPVAMMGLPAGAKLRRYVVTDLVTVQIPVRREVVCWEDAEGNVHELDEVEAPEDAKKVGVPGQATWWFNDGPQAPVG